MTSTLPRTHKVKPLNIHPPNTPSTHNYINNMQQLIKEIKPQIVLKFDPQNIWYITIYGADTDMGIKHNLCIDTSNTLHRHGHQTQPLRIDTSNTFFLLPCYKYVVSTNVQW